MNVFWDDGWLSKILSKPQKKCTKKPSFFSVLKTLLLLSFWYNCP
ncbi:MAG: hypothetical protein AVDCRST_MAG96-3468 [uncultured Segetibacter sp.]|uniref:Uncharacterized protein n=1 Tax=uncultured Segetibacter sp. TaxID=481133 RepID=A0A6J4TSW7_9BACT|nr:MAG: hypothetical protein AVDCRST_MAG96-3468 [uncultured Segetibacter sp.]